MSKDKAKSAWSAHRGPWRQGKTRRELIGVTALAAAVALLPTSVRSQERFPARNIRIIVPFPAGATTDMLARLFAQRMSEGLSQSVVVENVGGAGGSLGADQVAKAAPDGYTLLFHNITFTTTTSSLQSAGRSPHDIEQDFVPIAVGAYVPLLLLSHPSVPAREPQGVRGLCEADQRAAVLRFHRPRQRHEPDGRSAQTRHRDQDGSRAVSRRCAVGAGDAVGPNPIRRRALSSSLQHVRAGALNALAVTSRSAALPDVASTRELGFPNLDLRGWNGFFAPKGTPEPVIARLQREIAAAAKHPDLQKRITDVGAEPSGSSQAEMREMLREQIAKVRPMVEELKLVMQ